MCNANDFFEAQMSWCRNLLPESVPRCAAISANGSFLNLVLELPKCVRQARSEACCIEREALLLGVMQIIDVDSGKPVVSKTARDLIRDKGGGKRVPATDDFGGTHHTAVEVLGCEKRIVKVPRGRRCSVERDVSALGCHDDLVTSCCLLVDRAAYCSARCALRALTAIVDCGIDQIETTLDTSSEDSRISCVFVIVEVTEVGAHTDG